MELNANALVTYEYFIEMMGTDKYPPDMRDRVVGLINWISSKAISVVGRPILSNTFTTVLDGLGSCRLYLPMVPVASVESIVIDCLRIFDVEPITNYYLDGESGVVTRNDGIFPSGSSNVKVVYTAGYTQDTLPEEVKKACLEAIQTAWNRQNDNSYGVTSRSDPNGISVSYETRLSADVYDVFSHLRIQRV